MAMEIMRRDSSSFPENDDESTETTTETQKIGSKHGAKNPPKFDYGWGPSIYTKVKTGDGELTKSRDLRNKVTSIERTKPVLNPDGSVKRNKEGEKIFRIKKIQTGTNGKQIGQTTTKVGTKAELKAYQPKQTRLGSGVQGKIDRGCSKRAATGGALAESGASAGAKYLVSQLGRKDVLAEAKYAGVSISGSAGSASASFLSASAGAYHGTLGAGVYANASVAKAAVSTKGLGGTDFGAAKASAAAVSADANADASVLGVSAGAGARVAKAQAGIEGTPLQASASFLEATSYASARVDDLSVGAGASIAEAVAGPIGVRAGLAIGVGVKGGVPYADVGPVRLPCCIQ